MAAAQIRPQLLEENESPDIDQTILSSNMTLADIERVVIIAALRRNNANRTRTAQILGIGIRTLQRKIKQYCDDKRPEFRIHNVSN